VCVHYTTRTHALSRLPIYIKSLEKYGIESSFIILENICFIYFLPIKRYFGKSTVKKEKQCPELLKIPPKRLQKKKKLCSAASQLPGILVKISTELKKKHFFK